MRSSARMRNRCCSSPGDFERLVESADVAVILPEILKHFKGRLTAASSKDRPSARCSAAIASTPSRRWFSCEATAISARSAGVLDWQEYLAEIARILALEPSVPPPFEFPRLRSGCWRKRCGPGSRTLWRAAMSGLSGTRWSRHPALRRGRRGTELHGNAKGHAHLCDARGAGEGGGEGLPARRSRSWRRSAVNLACPPLPGRAIEIGLNALDKANRDFVGQVLGEGEVSIIAGATIQAQESVMAGIWRIYEVDAGGAPLQRPHRGWRFSGCRAEGRAGCGRAAALPCGGHGGRKSDECAGDCDGACG